MSKSSSSTPATPATDKPSATPIAIDVDAIKAAVIANAHPVANLFPMMNKDEFNNLCISLRQTGFDHTQPIKKNKLGKITDGRNREAATQVVNAEIALWNADPKNADKQKPQLVPVYVEEENSNDALVLAEVLRTNLHRRHLTASQKAAVVVKAGILSGAYKKKDELGDAGKKVAGDVAAMIAEQHGVNVDYIYKVNKIAKFKNAKAPGIGAKLLEAIAAGEKTVMAAYAEIQKIDSGETDESETSDEGKAAEVLDGTKKAVPEEWKSTFSSRQKFADAAGLLRQFKKLVDEIAAADGGQLVAEGNNAKEIKDLVNKAARGLKGCEPHILCPHCDGEGKKDGAVCPVCAGLAWLTETQYDSYLKHGVPTLESEEEEGDEGAAEAEEKPAKGKAKPKAKGKAKPEAEAEAAPADGEPTPA